MNKSVRVVFDRKSSVAKTGYGKIEIYVYLSRVERTYETVGEATADNWEIVAQSKNVVSKIKHYEQVIQAMRMLGEEMTVANFNNHIYAAEKKGAVNEDNKHMYKGNDQRQSFIEFVENYMPKEGLADGTSKHIKVVLESMKEAKMLLTFADLTPANLIKYDEYLHAQGDKSLSTIFGYHKRIKKYTRILWRSEMIPNNPYNYVQFKRGTHKERQPLTEKELLTIRKAKLSDKLSRARDLFVFMAYTGLAYVDMCKFNFQTMTDKEGKYYYIDGSRVKTGSKFYAPILPPAQAVLEKYHFKLPLISNQKLNDYLGVIKEKLEINKSMTCHVGRHSFATLLLNHGFSIERTARALGHKDIKTTQVYAKILKSSMVDSTERLLTNIK